MLGNNVIGIKENEAGVFIEVISRKFLAAMQEVFFKMYTVENHSKILTGRGELKWDLQFRIHVRGSKMQMSVQVRPHEGFKPK